MRTQAPKGTSSLNVSCPPQDPETEGFNGDLKTIKYTHTHTPNPRGEDPGCSGKLCPKARCPVLEFTPGTVGLRGHLLWGSPVQSGPKRPVSRTPGFGGVLELVSPTTRGDHSQEALLNGKAPQCVHGPSSRVWGASLNPALPLELEAMVPESFLCFV